MNNIILNTLGRMLSVFRKIYARHHIYKLYSELGEIGKNSSIQYPNEVICPKNIFIGNNVSIRSYSIMTACNAKIIIKDWTIVAPYLYISTGNHMMIPGRYTGSITNAEKDDKHDKDVIVNEDVWIGARVTLLMGVNIGRGAVVAAGAVVNKDVLPYSIVGGVPAKFIKFKWNIDEILLHERELYPEEERYSREQLEAMGIK